MNQSFIEGFDESFKAVFNKLGEEGAVEFLENTKRILRSIKLDPAVGNAPLIKVFYDNEASYDVSLIIHIRDPKSNVGMMIGFTQ